MESNRRRSLEEFLGGLAARPLVPSLVVCAGEAGEGDPGFRFTAGFADREAERPPTLDTVYGLGSTSKTFVAVCVLRLVADGVVKLHDPIAAVLPSTKQLPIFEDVTIHHLLTHTSGLAPLDARYAALDRSAPADFTGGADRPRPAELALPPSTPGLGFVDHLGLIEYLAAFDLDPIAPPGRQFSYSNEGYVLLTGVVAEASNGPYEDFCRTHAFEPLGLSSTAFIGSAAAASLVDVATPYKHDDDGLIPVSWWDAPAWAGPGGVLASACDLLRFAHAVRTSSIPGIPADLVATMCAPHASRGSDGWYGYGLSGVRVGGRPAVGHAGGRLGTRADMVWLEDGPAAVAFVNHSAGPAGPAAHAALLALVGEDPNRATAAPPARPYLPVSAIDPARIVGDYAAAEGGAVRVAFDASTGQLLAHVLLGGDEGGTGIPVHPVTADTYEARLGGGAMTLPFLIDGLGPAWGVEFGGRVLTRSPHVRRRSRPTSNTMPGATQDRAARSWDYRLLLAGRMLRAFGFGLSSAIIGVHLERLGMRPVLVGLTLTVGSLTAAVLGLALTALAARIGRRRVMALTGLAMAATGIDLAVGSPTWLVALAGLTGMLSASALELGPAGPIEQAMVAESVEPSQRNRAFGRYALVGGLAAAAGSLTTSAGVTLDRSRALYLLFAVVGIVCALLPRLLSENVEVALREARAFRNLRPIRGLAALFFVDALGGGFVTSSVIAYWLHVRFDAPITLLGPLVTVLTLVQAASYEVAGRLADRVGLVNTMVWTQLPANACLILVAFSPSLPVAMAFLLVRFAISQMDVPARAAYVVSIVPSSSRAEAAATTSAVRGGAQALGPVLSGFAIQTAAFAVPFVIGAALKIGYDVALLVRFRSRHADHERFGTLG